MHLAGGPVNQQTLIDLLQRLLTEVADPGADARTLP
jgi:hypothetical protein